MKKINKLEKLYKDWSPSDIAFIKAITWSFNNLAIIFYCQLRHGNIVWPDLSKDFVEVSMIFKNVSHFKLDFSGSGLHQISGFDILDISDSGLEKINFQIEDYEDNSICFNCEVIEINQVSNPGKIPH